MGNYKAKGVITNINLVVENVGGLGVNRTKKEGKHWAKFALKLMCPELYQINGKVQGNDRYFEN